MLKKGWTILISVFQYTRCSNTPCSHNESKLQIRSNWICVHTKGLIHVYKVWRITSYATTNNMGYRTTTGAKICSLVEAFSAFYESRWRAHKNHLNSILPSLPSYSKGALPCQLPSVSIYHRSPRVLRAIHLMFLDLITLTLFSNY
jgi:hypothetical protein